MSDAALVLKLYRDPKDAIMRWRGLSRKEAEDAVKRAGGKLD